MSVRRRLRVVCMAALITGAGASAEAQRYAVLGPQQCIKCHDHQDQKTWWEKRDGPPPAGHINALRQMESPKSDGFAAAIGQADKYDPAGACVRCHATVFKGQPRQGVSCETCHGAGSGYLELHQEKGAYEQAVAAGMADVRSKPAEWVRLCTACHVVDDRRLVQAGHPSGDDFDVATKFVTVAGANLHWKSRYERSAIAAIAQPLRTAAIAKRGGPAAAAPATAAPATAALATAALATAALATAAAAAASSAPAVAMPAPAAAAPAASPRARTVPPPVTGLPAPAPVPSAAPVPEALPRSAVGAVAAVRGRALMILADLLRAGSRAAIRVTPPPPPPDYRGVDAELLRLQDEVLALALEVLGTAPAAPAPLPKE